MQLFLYSFLLSVLTTFLILCIITVYKDYKQRKEVKELKRIILSLLEEGIQLRFIKRCKDPFKTPVYITVTDCKNDYVQYKTNEYTSSMDITSLYKFYEPVITNEA